MPGRVAHKLDLDLVLLPLVLEAHRKLRRALMVRLFGQPGGPVDLHGLLLTGCFRSCGNCYLLAIDHYLVMLAGGAAPAASDVQRKLIAARLRRGKEA